MSNQKTVQRAEYENLLARLLAETDPRRRREISLKLEFAKQRAESAERAKVKPQ